MLSHSIYRGVNKFGVRNFATFHTKLAIVGGGCGGTQLSSTFIRSGQIKAKDVTVFDPQQKHYYQPSFTNVSGGLWSKRMQEKYCSRDISDVLHKELNFVNRGVQTFDPDNNALYTSDGNKYTYDYLVVSSGLQLRWDMIEGAMDALRDPDCPAASMYILPFAQKMSKLRQNFKGGKAIFTVGKMPIKCGGAP